MHLPILLVGMLAGPYAGFLAGLFGPLASYALSGMPGIVMLPFMMIELAGYGAVAGLLRGSRRLPTFAQVLVAQAAGRALRAIAILGAVYLLGNQKIQPAVIWTSIRTGLPGLLLQWSLLPLLVSWVEQCKANEKSV